jgi:hypothetical protein
MFALLPPEYGSIDDGDGVVEETLRFRSISARDVPMRIKEVKVKLLLNFIL